MWLPPDGAAELGRKETRRCGLLCADASRLLSVRFHPGSGLFFNASGFAFSLSKYGIWGEEAAVFLFED